MQKTLLKKTPPLLPLPQQADYWKSSKFKQQIRKTILLILTIIIIMVHRIRNYIFEYLLLCHQIYQGLMALCILFFKKINEIILCLFSGCNFRWVDINHQFTMATRSFIRCKAHTSLKSKLANFWIPFTKTILLESSWAGHLKKITWFGNKRGIQNDSQLGISVYYYYFYI